MPEYTIAEGDFGVHEIPLTPDTEAKVTFRFSVRDVEVENVTGTARVYFTTDGTQPTVKGPNCRALPAALHAVEITRGSYSAGANTVIRLVTAGTTTVSVTRL